ncbi:cyclin-dependent kinase inhibitor 3 isoform X1 [Syzygium oleosum]|uniref:cyclin-dependent kinase inhibitor 3 isoform X1 n=1 Tax=Syzygium oleosum TaxID=219896 RepID=UPI0024BAAB54|nr:cyclin-dependent kinase inhibitor 3 isoform X1 [Syzygium oleosum]
MQAPREGKPAAVVVKMGKYMKKSKTITRDVLLPEVSPRSSAAGVRTRAKTLASRRPRRASRPPPPAAAAAAAPSSDASPCPFSYLQLRSRRLRKPCLAPSEARRDEVPVGRRRAESGSGGSCDASCSAGTASLGGGVEGDGGCVGRSGGGNGEECACDAGVDASFGENDLEIEDTDSFFFHKFDHDNDTHWKLKKHKGTNPLEKCFPHCQRGTRETTPCSLIRDLNANTPPGSTTRQQSSCTAHRTQMSILRSIPASDEMEEFFAYAERRQQRSFIEKYNFDIVKDLPLPGRFEWVQVIP